MGPMLLQRLRYHTAWGTRQSKLSFCVGCECGSTVEASSAASTDHILALYYARRCAKQRGLKLFYQEVFEGERRWQPLAPLF